METSAGILDSIFLGTMYPNPPSSPYRTSRHVPPTSVDLSGSFFSDIPQNRVPRSPLESLSHLSAHSYPSVDLCRFISSFDRLCHPVPCFGGLSLFRAAKDTWWIRSCIKRVQRGVRVCWRGRSCRRGRRGCGRRASCAAGSTGSRRRRPWRPGVPRSGRRCRPPAAPAPRPASRRLGFLCRSTFVFVFRLVFCFVFLFVFFFNMEPTNKTRRWISIRFSLGIESFFNQTSFFVFKGRKTLSALGFRKPRRLISWTLFFLVRDWSKGHARLDNHNRCIIHRLIQTNGALPLAHRWFTDERYENNVKSDTWPLQIE